MLDRGVKNHGSLVGIKHHGKMTPWYLIPLYLNTTESYTMVPWHHGITPRYHDTMISFTWNNDTFVFYTMIHRHHVITPRYRGTMVSYTQIPWHQGISYHGTMTPCSLTFSKPWCIIIIFFMIQVNRNYLIFYLYIFKNQFFY